MVYRFCIGISFVLLLVACKEESASELVELDLMSQGMPILIKAPPDAEIKEMNLVLSKDITVIKDRFQLQIFESDADTRDVGVIKQRLISEVRKNPFFSQILQEDPAGFIYETKVDSNYTNYGFRHIRIQGDKEYIFQQALRGRFAKEDVDLMYSAVQ